MVKAAQLTIEPGNTEYGLSVQIPDESVDCFQLIFSANDRSVQELRYKDDRRRSVSEEILREILPPRMKIIRNLLVTDVLNTYL